MMSTQLQNRYLYHNEMTQTATVTELQHNVVTAIYAPTSRLIGRVSLARENEAGGRKSIFSILTYRTLFCFCL